MRPSLDVGWRLRVAPLPPGVLPAPGQIVVLRAGTGAAEFVTHRVVAVATAVEGALVFHRGDAGGGVGMAAGAQIVGRVVAILAPPGAVLPELEQLDERPRRAFQAARRRALVYLACRRAAGRHVRVALLARWARRLLLGA